MKLSVIAPTYNEAKNVGRLIAELETVLHSTDYEIVISDDDSPDLTWAKVEEIGRRNPRVRALRRTSNRGLGPSVVDGFCAATGDAVACIDADLQHDPMILTQMLKELTDGADLVVATRYMPGGGTANWGVIRRLGSWGCTKLAQILLGVKLRDPMSGYFMMRREDFLRIRDRLNTRGFKILLEIAANMPHRRLSEVPYTFGPRAQGESKLSNKIIFTYLSQVWRLSNIGQICSRRFLKFALVGASGVFVNLAVLALLSNTVALRDWRASALASLVANLGNYIMNNMWTYADRIHRRWALIPGYFSYLFMSLLGLSVSTATYAVLTWSLRRLTLPGSRLPSISAILFCQLAGVLAGTFFNYFMNTNITWRSRTPNVPEVRLDSYPRDKADAEATP